MALTLTIENESHLPDGGPLSISISGRRGLDIGRDQHLDWTLPDPSRFISGKHCEVRYQDGGYWLHDVSTNGTFLYGKDTRLKEPYRLRNGDRLVIGQYVILVAVEGEAGARETEARQPAHQDDLWTATSDAAPPIDAKHLRAPRDSTPVRPDFLDWAVDLPNAHSPAAYDSVRTPGATRDLPPPDHDGMSWARGPALPPPAEPEIAPVPTPRRPARTTGERDNDWSAPPLAQLAEADGNAPLPLRPNVRVPPAPRSPDPRALDDFVHYLARGAGVSDEVFAAQNPMQLAEDIGVLIRLVAENVRQLLDARLHAKRFARSSNQTVIQAFDNNPLKFSTTTEEALRVMFGPRTQGYLEAQRALEQGFSDLKTHQIKTFSAMQHAVRLLVANLDPQAIEEAAKPGGLAAMVGSRKSKLWDTYVDRWEAQNQRHPDGLVDAFMAYFAECYDREGNEIK